MRDEAGAFVSFSPDFGRVWRWKDELPEQRSACAGKHLGRFVALLSQEALADVFALRVEPELGPLQRELVEAVREQGPCSGPELRLLLGTSDRRSVAAAVDGLQRQLVLTNAGVVEQEGGWPAVRVDLLERRFPLARLPEPREARRRLASRVLESAGEASAADVAAALGWPVKQAATVLESIGDPSYEEDGVRSGSKGIEPFPDARDRSAEGAHPGRRRPARPVETAPVARSASAEGRRAEGLDPHKRHTPRSDRQPKRDSFAREAAPAPSTGKCERRGARGGNHVVPPTS